MMTTKNSTRKRREYTPEFRADAVRLATAPGANIAQTARDVGIGDSLLRKLDSQGAPRRFGWHLRGRADRAGATAT